MPIESTAVPVDIDRQCMPEKAEKACREGLLCIRLFIPRVLSDGGLSEAANYTCHPICQDNAGCPSGYQCFAPMPPPMSPVCVRSEVVTRLQPDGGL